jgi:hypothetical protein
VVKGWEVDAAPLTFSFRLKRLDQLVMPVLPDVRSACSIFSATLFRSDFVLSRGVVP